MVRRGYVPGLLTVLGLLAPPPEAGPSEMCNIFADVVGHNDGAVQRGLAVVRTSLERLLVWPQDAPQGQGHAHVLVDVACHLHLYRAFHEPVLAIRIVFRGVFARSRTDDLGLHHVAPCARAVRACVRERLASLGRLQGRSPTPQSSNYYFVRRRLHAQAG